MNDRLRANLRVSIAFAEVFLRMAEQSTASQAPVPELLQSVTQLIAALQNLKDEREADLREREAAAWNKPFRYNGD